MHIHTLLCIYMYYICILLLCIYIYIPGLRKDTHNCPFARFLPSGRISCEGPGNCHFLTTVVKFAFRTFWADLTLLCINKFFLDRNSREKGGNNRETGGNTLADSTWLKLKTWSGQVFSWNCHFILTWTFSFFYDRNRTKICWTEICSQWITRYIHTYYIISYIYTGWWFGTCFIFPYIGNVIIPTDFHIFQRGRLNHQPVLYYTCYIIIIYR